MDWLPFWNCLVCRDCDDVGYGVPYENKEQSMSNMKKIIDLVAEQAETLRTEMSRFKL